MPFEDLEQRIAADSSVCGARFISSQAVDSHQYGGSPEFIELLNEIEELRKAADAQLEQALAEGRDRLAMDGGRSDLREHRGRDLGAGVT